MFDDVIRELRNLERGMTISIELPLDEDGCLDRRCPGAECGAAFKVPFDDWRDRVPDEQAFCPFCGHAEDPQEWNTPDQPEYIRQVGLKHVSGLLDSAFTRSARRFNQKQRTKPRDGLLALTMSMQYKPGAPIIAVPPASAEALRQQFSCESCSCRWSSLGASYFCPACGHNSVDQAFSTTIETVQRFLASIPSLRETLSASIGREDTETTLRQLTEDQMVRLVGAFERFSASMFDQLPRSSGIQVKGNAFQRIRDASELWRQATGKGFDDLIESAAVDELHRLVHQRHVLGHKQGIVDQRYIDKSGDTRYRVGQRLVIKEEQVDRLASIVGKLGAAMRDQRAAAAGRSTSS